jgi:hypothetical protein
MDCSICQLLSMFYCQKDQFELLVKNANKVKIPLTTIQQPQQFHHKIDHFSATLSATIITRIINNTIKFPEAYFCIKNSSKNKLHIIFVVTKCIACTRFMFIYYTYTNSRRSKDGCCVAISVMGTVSIFTMEYRILLSESGSVPCESRHSTLYTFQRKHARSAILSQTDTHQHQSVIKLLTLQQTKSGW